MVIKNTKKYIEDKKAKNLYGLDFMLLSHPGETLKDEIEFFGLTQIKVAARAGCTVQTINRIINGRESISPDMALKLERIFEGRPSAQFWLNMQSAYDNETARVKEEKEAEKEIGFFKEHLEETFKELQRIGLCEKIILRKNDDFKRAVLLIKNFFEAAILESIHDKNVLSVALRRYNKKNKNEYNLAALIKIGEKKARKFLNDPLLKDYNEKLFFSELFNIKSLTKKNPSIFLDKLQQKCLELGVIVVYVPNIRNTYFGGATTRIGGHPVIILKTEKQREDIFWFNFFHEAGHVINHSKKEFFIDFDKDGEKTDNEKEADLFAKEILIPDFDKIVENFNPKSVDSWLEKSAQSMNVSKSIIAGRICNDVKNKKIWPVLSKHRPVIKEKVKL